MLKEYTHAVLIARIQPPHRAHIMLIDRALDKADKVILVLGSHAAALDIHNPWSANERMQMVKSCFPYEKAKRLIFCPVRDQPYNNTNWIASVHHKVNELTEYSNKVALFGHKKDSTSYYLDYFPQWDFIDNGLMMQGLSATEIREQYFDEGIEGKKWHDRAWRNSVHEGVCDFLEKFKKTERYDMLVKSHVFIKGYRKSWENAPFAPTFVTTDAVVEKSGHVLLIRRKVPPGQNQVALPGGFLNQDEFIVDGMIRELKEETRISESKATLKAAIVNSHVFDKPGRSLRGRTITHASHVKLPDGGPLPRVKGADDALGAFWCPIADLYSHEQEFFSDHLHIINFFLSR